MPLLVLGDGRDVLQACGIASTLRDGSADPGLVIVASDAGATVRIS